MDTQLLQQKLKSAGFDPGPIDGDFGPATIAAVTAFQRAHNLNPDGIVGKLTMEALGTTADWSVSDDGTLLVTSFEGEGDGNKATPELDPYLDIKGLATCGYGHLIRDEHGNPINAIELGVSQALALARQRMRAVFHTDALTHEQAIQIMHQDLNEFSAAVNNACKTAKTPMTQCRFDAMTSFAFNIGAGAYKSSSMYRFHTLGGPFGEPISPSLLVYASKQGLDPHNVAEGFAAYSRASHVWTRGLFRRRLAEALVYSGRDVGEAVRFAQTYNC